MQILDVDLIAQLRALPGEGAKSLLDEVIGVFLAELPGRVEAIAAAVAAGDAPALERAAHALKGCAAALGAVQLGSLCGTAEEQAQSGKVDGAALAPLRAAAGAARAALMSERSR